MMDAATGLLPVKNDRKSVGGWLALGFALGGFFDGIVLHQVLQWHHLLSGLDDPLGSDLRFQIAADGFFHVFMYVVAVCGTALLVAARASGAPGLSTSRILRLALVGFGTWHALDSVVSHWLLGIHRIKMDSEAPLVWDLAWLLVFGILPIVFALTMRDRGTPSSPAAAALLTTVLLAGGIAATGPRFSDQADTIVIFRADVSQPQAMAALSAAGAALKWTDAGATVWGIDAPSWTAMAILYARGALVVGNTPAVAGCLAWTRRAEAV